MQFESICSSLMEMKHNYFNSIYGQWIQVWHGFQTKNSIAELVLSVAIEGILNDNYIPVFKRNRIDPLLVSDIDRIKSIIKDIDISENHKQRLIGSVSYWKNITVSKALDILTDEGVIGENDKKIWSELRNEAAHPQVKNIDILQQQIKRDKMLQCLNLFHKLVLNVVEYTRPVYIFSMDKDTPVELIRYKDVLDD